MTIERTRADVSLVIPLRNEAGTLAALIDSIERQTLLPHEVIFVDGASDDGTAQMLQRAAEARPDFRVISAGPSLPGTSRNKGAALATSTFIAFTDAGAHVSDNWLEALVTAQRENDADVVWGHYEPVADTLFSGACALTYVTPASKTPDGRAIRAPSVASMLIRRVTFEETGGFPAFRASEDHIFMQRLARLDPRTAYAPDARMYWQLPQNFTALFSKYTAFSCANLEAGRAAQWHYGTLRIYTGALALAIAGIFWHPFWILLVLAIVARIARTVTKRWPSAPREARNPASALLAGAVLFTLDVATAAGSVRYFRQRAGR